MNIWAGLAGDVGGVVIFLLWLALPPLYVVALGRHYLRRCREELERVQDYVDDVLGDDEWAVEEPTETTTELPAALPHDRSPFLTAGKQECADRASGKHRLHE